MLKTNIKDLSVKEIMNRIKQEIAKRKEPPVKPETSVIQKQESSIPDAVTFQATITYQELSLHNEQVVYKTEETFEIKEVYEIGDFTKFADESFINNAYIGILGRQADIYGKEHYLKLLRSGEYSKVEILIALRFSKEGKRKGANILCIKKRYVRASLYKLPFVGYVVKSIHILFTLPNFLKRFNQYRKPYGFFA
ncbi:DUF4214 domain-containing protein [Candidatus Acidulodesulfobacterium sp. H_13]|uniref:DUF4214 domain-containing protein n=1 Tax=Candidatus Acidulodesulfobacterium sp. H_13 TaxID=3395470 RepID=UPI003AF9FD51